MKLVIFSTASTVVADYYPFGMPMPNRTLGPGGLQICLSGAGKGPRDGQGSFSVEIMGWKDWKMVES